MKHLVHFAIKHSTVEPERTNARGRVAQRFHADPTTTRLVSIDRDFRLYVMETY